MDLLLAPSEQRFQPEDQRLRFLRPDLANLDFHFLKHLLCMHLIPEIRTNPIAQFGSVVLFVGD